MLASLQVKLSEAAAPAPQPDPQLDSEADASMGNPLHPADGAQGGAAPVVPSGTAEPSGDAAPALVPSTDAAVSAPAAATLPPEDSQQGADFSAMQEETELVAQANVLCLAVQYESAPLAEARAAFGARLVLPPLDFESIKRDIQKVHEAVAKQAEADDVPPQAESQRPET